MKTKSFFLTALLAVLSFGSINAADRLVGGDISELPTMEGAKAIYLDKSGNPISDIITYSYDQGMNAMRVRLFVDPDYYLANVSGADPYACQSYDYILPICQRIKAAGHKLLLDFHYSDTWADPASQWTPNAWASLSDEDLYAKIYDYTKQVLTDLKAAGAEPDYIQTGNEISYGMCWGPHGTSTSNLKKAYTAQSNTGTNASNLTRFANLLKNATKACRDVCPKAGIVLHIERVAQSSVLTGFYTWAKNESIDYDIIGLSYYPHWHGDTPVLETALSALDACNFGKEIWIVETGSMLNWQVNGAVYNPGVTDDDQNAFTQKMLEVLDKHSSVTGVFWWEMDYNAYKTSPALNNWYNGGLFNNNTGVISKAFYTLAAWASGEPSEKDDDDDTYPDHYLLYNNNSGSWAVPGTIFTNHLDGTYELKEVTIAGANNDDGWFAITTTPSVDWNAINANRYGPSTNNEDPSSLEKSYYSQNTNSWQVPAGTYDITLDTNNGHIVVVKSNSSGINNILDTDEVGEAVYYNLQGVKVVNPSNGIYVKVVNGKSTKVLVK